MRLNGAESVQSENNTMIEGVNYILLTGTITERLYFVLFIVRRSLLDCNNIEKYYFNSTSLLMLSGSSADTKRL